MADVRQRVRHVFMEVAHLGASDRDAALINACDGDVAVVEVEQANPLAEAANQLAAFAPVASRKGTTAPAISCQLAPAYPRSFRAIARRSSRAILCFNVLSGNAR